jgi:radical SAM-linked protein
MRVRVQFSKNGEMKYIGHLDVMRYFQKAIRRAELPAAYSDGFSPHMIMSFAAPLGVGITSDSEYFDLDLTEPMPSAEMVKRLDQEMAPGIRVKRVCEIPEEKKAKGMTVVAAASYRIQCVNPEKIPKNIGGV